MWAAAHALGFAAPKVPAQLPSPVPAAPSPTGTLTISKAYHRTGPALHLPASLLSSMLAFTFPGAPPASFLRP